MSTPSSQPATRVRLHEATLRLIARDGPGASVRAIAKEAGLTEGALYRHYTGRGHLVGAVFAELIEPMIAEKENLVAMRAPVRDRLREWVRCTYARFDRDPDGFAYIFLTDHDLDAEYASIAGRQSALLSELFAQGRAEGLLRSLPDALGESIFVALLLSVPHRIRDGALARPASAYVDEIARAAWAALAADTPRPEATPVPAPPRQDSRQ